MISEEPFWSSLKNAVNTFKIRGSYGKVGNDQLGNDDRWLYQSTIITGNSFTMGETGNSGGTGIAMGRPENLDFSWGGGDQTRSGCRTDVLQPVAHPGRLTSTPTERVS